MGHTSKMFVIAGAALSLSGVAFAAESDTSRAYANELKADAAGRTSLAAGGKTSGLTITDGSGNFSMRVGGLMLFRYSANFRTGSTPNTTPVPATGGGVTGKDKATIGFSARRTQLYFSGNAGSPEITYYIQGNFNTAGNVTNGTFILQDAFVKYTFDNNWDVRWGQFKLPILTEDLIGDGYQQSADRSTMANIYRQQRSQGIQVAYSADVFRVLGAFSDGWRSANTDYNNPAEADYALTLRVDGKFAGDWNQWNQFSSWQNSQFAAFLGGAVHWQQGGSTGDGADAVANVNQTNYLLWTIDTQIKGNGWNVFAAIVGSHAKIRNGGPTFNSYGWQVQGGFFATQQIELFARYDGFYGSRQQGLVPRTFHFLDFGLNYYLFPESQTAKITGDVLIGLTRSQGLQNTNFQGTVPGGTNPFPDTFSGALGSPKAGEVGLRVQFQLLF
ncbi:MAG TPA: porin [Phycisphaerales bacterium]